MSFLKMDDKRSCILVTLSSGLSCLYYLFIFTTLRIVNLGLDTYHLFSVICSFIVLEIIKYYATMFYIKKTTTKLDERVLGRKNYQESFVQNSGKVVLVMFASWVLFSIIIILLGAPVLEMQNETCLLSLLITVLTVFPICLHVGPHAVLLVILNIKPEMNVQSAFLKRNAQLTVCGAWLAAFVFPLDWDRPWQVYPVPCVVGALFGHMLSNFMHLVIMTIKLVCARYSSRKSVKRS